MYFFITFHYTIFFPVLHLLIIDLVNTLETIVIISNVFEMIGLYQAKTGMQLSTPVANLVLKH